MMTKGRARIMKRKIDELFRFIQLYHTMSPSHMIYEPALKYAIHMKKLEISHRFRYDLSHELFESICDLISTNVDVEAHVISDDVDRLVNTLIEQEENWDVAADKKA